MEIREIAKRVHELTKSGEYFTSYDELYSPDAIAYEPQLAEMGLAETKGIPAIKDKVTQLGSGIAELISREMSEPIVSANYIAFTNIVKAKLKDGNEFNMSEICLYEVRDGKIVSERFFY